MYIEKKIMIVLHATPKNHPGGVQGALSKFWYQSEDTPGPVKRLPMPKAAKFRRRKMNVRKIIADAFKGIGGNFHEPFLLFAQGFFG